jgi:hypothetical protein
VCKADTSEHVSSQWGQQGTSKRLSLNQACTEKMFPSLPCGHQNSKCGRFAEQTCTRSSGSCGWAAEELSVIFICIHVCDEHLADESSLSKQNQLSENNYFYVGCKKPRVSPGGLIICGSPR